MLTEPLTINSVNLARVSSNDNRSIYLSADGTKKVTVSHAASGNRKRHLCRYDITTVAADPISSENVSQTLGVYFVVDEPDFGFSDSNIVDALVHLWNEVSADTQAILFDILEGQH